MRQWVDNSRRKIALALHSLGDEIHSPRSENGTSTDPREAEEQRRKQREELVRRNRERLYREGIDGLSWSEKPQPRADAGRSFDTLVGNDGMLKDNVSEKKGDAPTTQDESSTQSAVEMVEKEEGLRRRMQGVRGLERGAAFANPFADEEGQVLFDRSLMGVESDETASEVGETKQSDTRASSVTLSRDQDEPLIDISAPTEAGTGDGTQSHLHQEQEPLRQVPESSDEWADTASESFYSLQRSQHPSDSPHSSGTATPTEDNFSDSESLAGSGVAMDSTMSLNSSVHGEHPGTSDALSDAFSDLGVHTPGSWSDVGSEAGSDDFEQSHGHSQ